MNDHQCKDDKLTHYTTTSNKLSKTVLSISTLPSKSEEPRELLNTPTHPKPDPNCTLTRQAMTSPTKQETCIYSRVDCWLRDLDVQLAAPEESQYSFFEA